MKFVKANFTSRNGSLVPWMKPDKNKPDDCPGKGVHPRLIVSMLEGQQISGDLEDNLRVAKECLEEVAPKTTATAAPPPPPAATAAMWFWFDADQHSNTAGPVSEAEAVRLASSHPDALFLRAEGGVDWDTDTAELRGKLQGSDDSEESLVDQVVAAQSA